MGRLPGFFANRMMGTLGQGRLIGFPEIGIGTTTAIGTRNGVPQTPTGLRTAIPDDEGDNLSSATTQRCPQPPLFVLDNHDAELQATIENRKKVIRVIREVKAHLIITHRPNDYHADHRDRKS